MKISTPIAKKFKTICFVLAIVTTLISMWFLMRAIVMHAKSPLLTHEEVYNYCMDEDGVSNAIWTIVTDPLTVDEHTITTACPNGYVVSTTGDSMVISTTIDPLTVKGNTMILDVDRVGLVIRTDAGDILYQVNDTKLFTIQNAKGYVIFSLPENYTQTYKLYFEYSHMDNYMEAHPEGYTLGEIRVGTRYAITRLVIRESTFAFFVICSLLVIAICMITMVIYFAMHKMKDNRMLSLAVFMMTLAVWAFMDSSLPQLSGMSLELSGIFSNVALAVLPVPLIFFMWDTCGKDCVSFRFMILFTELNLIAQTILSMTGTFTLHQMLMVTHAILGLSVLTGLIECLRRVNKGTKEERRIFQHGMLAMLVLIVAYFAVVLMYWNGNAQYCKVFLASSCVTVLLFFAMIFMSYMSRLRAHRIERVTLETYQNLALKDGMTDLSNRRAFEQMLKNYDESPKLFPDAILVILDLNGLKKINDDYGHTAGDEAIVALADGIKKVYGLYGDCFRIGGDEFAVIITDLSKDVRGLNRQLEAYLESYRLPGEWKLSAAKGAAELYDRNGRRLSTAEWKQNADLSMYADKQLYATGRTVSRAEDLQAILDCVIGLVEAKDQYTAKHSDRVRDMAVEIAKWMNLSPDTIEQIDMAAHLHDIGKVGIPESVLMKPGRLTDEEFAIMKEHPVIGSLVIDKSNSMEEIADIVKHHHERYDGKGYPLGISGEDIPIGARVVAVADSIDAMTSKRCYRDSLGLDVCRSEIENNIGEMYDPAIATIVLEHWGEIATMVQHG